MLHILIIRSLFLLFVNITNSFELRAYRYGIMGETVSPSIILAAVR